MSTSMNQDIYKMFYPVFSQRHSPKPKLTTLDAFRRPKHEIDLINDLSTNFRKKNKMKLYETNTYSSYDNRDTQ